MFGYFSLINREIDQCDRSKECIKKKFETIDFTSLLYNKASIVFKRKECKNKQLFSLKKLDSSKWGYLSPKIYLSFSNKLALFHKG